MKNLVRLIIIFCMMTGVAIAQKSNHLQLDSTVWKEAIKDIHYDAAKEKNQQLEFRKPITTNWDFKNLKFFLFAGIILLVIIALIVIVKRSRQPVASKSIRLEANSIEEAEENLPDVKLNKIYQEALDKGEFKSALRIKFLMILQNMIDAEMVIWRKRKTNEQYLRELTYQEVKNSFQHIVKLYDSVWYGSKLLTEAQYQLTLTQIDALNEQLHGQK